MSTMKRRAIFSGDTLVPVGLVVGVLFSLFGLVYSAGGYAEKVNLHDTELGAVDERFGAVDARLQAIETNTAAMNAKLSVLIDLWRARDADDRRARIERP